MGTPTIPLLPSAEAVEAGLKVGISEAKAGIALYRALLHHPTIAKRINDLMEALSTDSEFDARLRELTVLRIGWLNDGVYEWTLHWHIAAQLGISHAEMIAVRDWQNHQHWSAADRAALRAADEIVANGRMTNESWVACGKCFQTHGDLLELVTIIFSWKMISDLIKNLDVPVDEGFAPWPPDGMAPVGAG